MKQMRIGFGILVLIFALALATPQSWAQRQQESQKGRDPRVTEPLPPLGPDESSSAARDAGATPEVTRASKPDQRPLSGVEAYTLSSMSDRRTSTLRTNLSFSQVADTNPTLRLEGGEILTQSLLRGQVSLEHFWSRYHLSATYSGGGAISQTHSGLNSHFHSLGLAQRMEFGRWNLTLGNDTSYAPESSFGFLGGLGGLGDGGFSVNQAFDLSDTILAGRTRRISNTSAAEVHYQATPRSTLTASGSYGLMLFPDSDLQDNRSMVFGLSHGYLLSRSDSFFSTYRYSRHSFDAASALESHAVNVGWGRRLARRLHLTVGGGPDLQHFPGGVGAARYRLSWSANASLSQMFRQGGLSLSYLHYTSGGSGVLQGAESDVASAAYWRRLARIWTLSFNGGYARNSGLEIVPGGVNQLFHSVFTGAALGRSLGQRANLSLNYSMQFQQASQPFCVAGTCGRRTLRHVFGLGIDFNFRPVGLD